MKTKIGNYIIIGCSAIAIIGIIWLVVSSFILQWDHVAPIKEKIEKLWLPALVAVLGFLGVFAVLQLMDRK